MVVVTGEVAVRRSTLTTRAPASAILQDKCSSGPKIVQGSGLLAIIIEIALIQRLDRIAAKIESLPLVRAFFGGKTRLRTALAQQRDNDK